MIFPTMQKLSDSGAPDGSAWPLGSVVRGGFVRGIGPAPICALDAAKAGRQEGRRRAD
jgi:hypothetical protein